MTHMTGRRRQSGISIVEALVALVVMSVGMLGIAAIYLQSVQSNRSAQSRTIAVQLVNDLADRIRANRNGRDAYKNDAGKEPAAVAKTADCSLVTCTPAMVAAYDLDQWFTTVKNRLPKTLDGKNPQVVVTVTKGTNPSDPDRYVIKTLWQEPGEAAFLSTQVEVFQLGNTTS